MNLFVFQRQLRRLIHAHHLAGRVNRQTLAQALVVALWFGLNGFGPADKNQAGVRVQLEKGKRRRHGDAHAHRRPWRPTAMEMVIGSTKSRLNMRLASGRAAATVRDDKNDSVQICALRRERAAHGFLTRLPGNPPPLMTMAHDGPKASKPCGNRTA